MVNQDPVAEDFSSSLEQASSETQAKNQTTDLEEEEIRFREEQVALMLLEEPVLAEQLLMKEELEKDHGENREEAEDDF